MRLAAGTMPGTAITFSRVGNRERGPALMLDE
jgi:hypothetical protein